MKLIVLIVILIVADTLKAQQIPDASFIAGKTTGCNPLTVQFSNNSQNAINYLWDFGNGDTSTAPNPSVIFYNAGSYTITLIATSSSGQSDTAIYTDYIEVSPRPVAGFSIPDNQGCANATGIIFNNSSTAAGSYTWDFGDGVTSTQQNPVHTYNAAGSYTVALIASNSIGCTDIKLLPQYVTITSKPSADFSADTTRYCALSHEFSFTPLYTSATMYDWNFHDGSSSSAMTPTHYFSAPGKYTVSLTVSDLNGCSSSLTKTNYISVSEELVPEISANKSTGCAPLNVSFSNNVTGTLSYSWNFGDGSGLSPAVNPLHQYTDTGIFTVSLTVTDANNCSFSAIADSLINTNDPLETDFLISDTSACAPHTVTFTDLSLNASSWVWDFGDGSSATVADPVYTYATPGTYTITLLTSNADNCYSTKTKINGITVKGPVSDFSASDSTGCIPLNVNFSDSSTGAVQWFWDFGDGATSTVKSPTHSYTSSGSFTVIFITTGIDGCRDTLVKPAMIHPVDPIMSYIDVDTIQSCNEITASFNGSSIGTNFWLWNFGDGNSSASPNPMHTYSAPGVYAVSLTTQTINGCTITINNYNVIKVSEGEVDFSYTYDSCPSFDASFSNTTADAVSWFWNFGDGTFSNNQNPIHTYAAPGVYSVALSVGTSEGCIFSAMKNNIIYFSGCDSGAGGGGGMSGGLPVGGNGNPDSTQNTIQLTGCAPFKAYFSNPFDSAVAFAWYFGDGDSSTLENPVHNYINAGLYDISLVVHFPDSSSNILVRNDFIRVNKVSANFTVQQNNECENSSVFLTNTTLNGSQQTWFFGDGNSSIAESPQHNYSNASNYLITLNSEDDFGCNSISAKNIFAGVVYPVFHLDDIICFQDTAAFSSNMENFYSYLWDFGDGHTSSDESPVHVYDSAGYYIISLEVFDSLGCTFNNIYPGYLQVVNPYADFNIPVNSGCNTLLASFNDLSADATNWNWDFGDGNTSVLQSPGHIYSQPGTYDVSLTVEKNGCVSTKTISNAITVHEAYADFGFVQDKLCFPVTATFSDSSKDAIAWVWNFGDGSVDSSQFPVHLFLNPPSGNISLSITDANGCVANISKSNIEQFIPEISSSAVQGCDSLTVIFSDQSEGATSWLWDFGDGNSSPLQNPSHFYSDSGAYTVMLIAASPDGCVDTSVFSNYVHVYKVLADFNSPSVLSGCNPLLVNFSDNSTNATQWNWSFGDMAASTQENPWHIYTFPGQYDITLIAKNSLGCSDTVSKTEYVNVTGPVASFVLPLEEGCNPTEIQFFDSSLNGVILTWFFGDGSISHDINPVHIFDTIGVFEVSLLAEDSSGCSSLYASPQKIEIYPSPSIEISDFVTSGCEPLEVFFDGKIQNADSATWDYGDGSSSHLFSGSHNFDSAGMFQPMLILTNDFGCRDTFLYPEISVNASPVAAFSAKENKGCSPLEVGFINESENLSDATFQWNFSNGETSTEINPTTFFDQGGLYDISLVVVNSSGCSDTILRENYIMAYDNFSPGESKILVATVYSNSSAMIVWEESNAVDFEKYILYRKNNQSGQYIEIAVFNDVDITSYMDENLNTLHNAYCYKLQSVDFCGNSRKLENITEYCTMNLTARPDSISIAVSWTPYRGCDVSGYEILRADKGSDDFKLLSKVDAGTLNYSDTSWYCFVEYVYKISAMDLCGNPINSYSDTSVAKADENIFANQQVEIIRSTVIENAVVYTEWKSPLLAPDKVAAYKIYRSEGNLKFELIATIPASYHSFTDGNVDVAGQNYYYKVESVNVCNIKSLMSNNASSILLEAENDKYEVKLKWTPYKNWENGVEHYIIERMDENGNWKIVNIVDGNITEYKDDLLK